MTWARSICLVRMSGLSANIANWRTQMLSLEPASGHADQAACRGNQVTVGLRTGSSATQGRAWPRSLRRALMAGTASTPSDAHDRARLPTIPAASTGQWWGEREYWTAPTTNPPSSATGNPQSTRPAATKTSRYCSRVPAGRESRGQSGTDKQILVEQVELPHSRPLVVDEIQDPALIVKHLRSQSLRQCRSSTSSSLTQSSNSTVRGQIKLDT